MTPPPRTPPLQGPVTPSYGPQAREPIEEHGEWLEEPDELPRRPRRGPSARLRLRCSAC